MPTSTEAQKQRARERAKQWAIDNPERYAARQAEWYQKNAERLRERARERRLAKLDEVRAYDRQRAADGKDQKREYDKRYRAANAEKIAADKKRWQQTPEGRACRNAQTAKRRARRKQLDCGCATPAVLRDIWASTNGLCSYCFAPAEHIDHITPLARGGKHCKSNLTPACASCNQRKNARNLLEFLAVA